MDTNNYLLVKGLFVIATSIVLTNTSISFFDSDIGSIEIYTLN